MLFLDILYFIRIKFLNINHSVVIVLLNGLLRLVEVYSQGKLLNLQIHWKARTACLLLAVESLPI